MIPLLTTVRLKEPDVKHGVLTDDKGCIVDVLNDGEAYIVEFVNADGVSNNKALLTEYKQEQLEIIH